MSVELAGIFRGHPGHDQRGHLDSIPDLEEVLGQLVVSARAQWPDVPLDPAAFVEQIAEVVSHEPDPEEALRSLNAADLFLARACAQGEPHAIGQFEATLLPVVDAAVAALGAPATIAQEARQIVSQKLLVGEDGHLPRIHDYVGRGPLRTWFRVVATRTVISLLRKERKHVPVSDDVFVALRSLDDDPELTLVKSTYRRAAKAAFTEAVQSLDVRQRNLLKHQLVDGLTVDEIGRIYHVHRVTASRWLAAARHDVWKRARRTLQASLRVGGTELDGVMRQIRSHLDLSLERVLLGPDGASDDE